MGHYVRLVKDYRGRKASRSIDLVSVLPPVDRLQAKLKAVIDANFQKALEKKRSGQKLGWKLPRQAASGMTRPTATFRVAEKRYCRHYVQELRFGKRNHTYYGLACRDQSGRWQIPGLYYRPPACRIGPT